MKAHANRPRRPALSNLVSLVRQKYRQVGMVLTKETILERADFALQLLMFVTAEKEGQMFIIFFLSIFCQLLSPRF